MFPTLSDLFNYLFHTQIQLPIQTLGFFIALSFVLTYLAFVAEFKRKEALGLIHAFKRKVIIGQPASLPEIFVNAIAGFIFGFKIIGALISYQAFVTDPKTFLISTQGNLWVGLLAAIGWGYWAYIDRKKQQLPQPVEIDETIHPYQLMGKITFWAAVWGFTGAKLFDTVEHIGYFMQHPIADLLSPNGFTYYGGFIFGMLSFYYVGTKNGMKLAHVSDTGAPGIMLAYSIGRIGCELSGDGDWGIVNQHMKPTWLHWLPDWAWSYNYPHNIANEGTYINGCIGDHCNVLINGVYPTPLYESVICLLLFWLMWSIRKHVNIGGFMSFLYLILAGTERFFIEFIRITIRYNIFGIQLSQAQIISILMFLVGAGGMIYLAVKGKFKVMNPKVHHLTH